MCALVTGVQTWLFRSQALTKSCGDIGGAVQATKAVGFDTHPRPALARVLAEARMVERSVAVEDEDQTISGIGPISGGTRKIALRIEEAGRKGVEHDPLEEIGRASCRERVCQYV